MPVGTKDPKVRAVNNTCSCDAPAWPVVASSHGSAAPGPANHEIQPPWRTRSASVLPPAPPPPALRAAPMSSRKTYPRKPACVTPTSPRDVCRQHRVQGSMCCRRNRVVLHVEKMRPHTRLQADRQLPSARRKGRFGAEKIYSVAWMKYERLVTMQRCVPSKGLSVPHRADLPDQVAAPNNSGMRVANCEGTRRVSEEPLSTAPVLSPEAHEPVSLLLDQMHRPAPTVLSAISARLIASRSPSLMFIHMPAVSCAEQPGAASAPILGPAVVPGEACLWAHGFPVTAPRVGPRCLSPSSMLSSLPALLCCQTWSAGTFSCASRRCVLTTPFFLFYPANFNLTLVVGRLWVGSGARGFARAVVPPRSIA